MTRSPDRDPMHDVVAGERENLLNSGVVSGGDAFREGVVGSGVGVPAKDATEQTAAGLGLRRMAAASLVDELDDSDELEGSRDVYDAAEGGRAIRRRLASRKAGRAAKSAENAGSQGTVPKSTGKAEAAADPYRQAAEMRAKSNGAAGATKASADAAASASAEMLELLHFTGQFSEGLGNEERGGPSWRTPSIPGTSTRRSSARSFSSTTTERR